ncbi:RraA family protein [Pendulispora brunnea]|uniref:Putative 4-hydroxy-4-methyl-2-oxoglutarate aldolase n=1 Tax=Pendulispora brunnea TaxID=2905690 RepID=A0ABZ2K9I7_9BACT
MSDYRAFQELSPTALANVLTREHVMDIGVRPLWAGMPLVAGPAYTVRCEPGDNLMLHAAIYRAPAGSVVVVDAGGDTNYAVAGGNVCAIARKRGIAAFVVDGVVRDLAEIRESAFPVFARGVIPIPGIKDRVAPLNAPVQCAGVRVSPGDVVVADEEGIVVVPHAEADTILREARKRADKEASETLDAWESAHRSRVEEILRTKGFV